MTWSKKRLLSGMIAVVLAMQPTMSIMAQSEEETTIRGEDYTIRANWDGTKTLTFTGELETAAGEIGQILDMDTQSEEAVEGEVPDWETHIEGSGEDTQITMEYGDYVIEFTPEIYEEAFDEEAAAEMEHTVKTRAAEEETEGQSEAVTVMESEAVAETEGVLESEAAPESEATQETETVLESEAVSETEQISECEGVPASETFQEEEYSEESEDTSEREVIQESEIVTESGMAETERETETEIPASTIRYQKLEDGIKEELVLYGYRGGHRIDYQFRFEGLHPELNRQSVNLQNEDGNLQATISAPYLYDAAGAKCYDIEVSLEQIGEDTYTLSYVPSDAWLADPERVYPVVLDPTIRTENSEQVEDNQAASGSQKGTQYPFYQTYMYAGNKDGITYITYCRPAIPDNVKSIADHIIITDAKVRIYVQEKKGSGPYTMHLVNEPWTSRTITGRNKPKISDKIYSTFKMNAGTRKSDLEQGEKCGKLLCCGIKWQEL